MKNKHYLFILLAFMVFSSLPVIAQNLRITVNDADERKPFTTSENSQLNAIFGQVKPAIIRSGADSSSTVGLFLDDEIDESVSDVTPHLTILGADSSVSFKSIMISILPSAPPVGAAGRIVVSGADDRYKLTPNAPVFSSSSPVENTPIPSNISTDIPPTDTVVPSNTPTPEPSPTETLEPTLSPTHTPTDIPPTSTPEPASTETELVQQNPTPTMSLPLPPIEPTPTNNPRMDAGTVRDYVEIVAGIVTIIATILGIDAVRKHIANRPNRPRR